MVSPSDANSLSSRVFIVILFLANAFIMAYAAEQIHPPVDHIVSFLGIIEL
jgi:hypothetical protein